MTKEEAINLISEMWELLFQEITNHTFESLAEIGRIDEYKSALDMAISALKDIEKIQIIVDAYFTRGSKSGYECMVEIDRFLEHYKKGE